MKKHRVLTEHQRTYVRELAQRDIYRKPTKRQYDYRIRQKAVGMIEDLTFLAIHLPESQQAQIFTKEMLFPLISAILDLKRDGVYVHSRTPARQLRRKRIYVANERIFLLCNWLIERAAEAGWELMDSDFATFAASSDMTGYKIESVRKMGPFVR